MSSAVSNAVLCIFAVALLSPQSIKGAEIERTSCGQSLVNTKARISNGRVSQRGWWPWQIGIYKVPDFHCGGALISRRWVLTAAHCFYDEKYFMGNTNLYQIKAGDHNLSVNETSQQEIALEKIFVHPRFKPKGVPQFDCDIALVKLSQKVELGEFVRTACLPEKSEGDLAIPDKTGMVAGWGVTRPLRYGERGSRNDLSKVLRHATVTIQSDQLCINRSGIQFNSTTAFCAGDGKGGEDACKGDSGGAFVREIGNSKWVVVGVVSWGNGCSQKDQYGYYTRIHPFLDWIKETMETGKRIRYQNCTRTNRQPNVCSKPCNPARDECRGNRYCVCDGDCGYSCVKRGSRCGPPTLPRGSTIIHPPKQGKYKKGSVVLFDCKQGFYLVGQPIIKCLGRRWTQRNFRCVGLCPDLRHISNGRVIDTSPGINQASVEFRCNKNFRLVGRSRLKCIDGRWNGMLPFCETSCPDPGHPENGKTIGSVFDHNSVVEFECLGDRLLQGSSQATCSNGQWDQVLPTCRDCGTGIPLGMESGKIPDKSIKASSQKSQHPAHYGRLGGGTNWCSEEEKNGFIQIDLPKKYKITGARIQLESKYNISVIILKGQIFEEWANFHYEMPPYNQEVEQIASKHPFIAQSIRIRVLRRIKQSICLRAEVYGCGIPKGCIMRGSAVLVKENGRYQRGIVGEYIWRSILEVYLLGNTNSKIVARSQLIQDEKPSIHELATGKLVLVEDVGSPGLITEGKIEQIEDSVCTIKTNDKTWKSDLNKIRIIKISDFCS